MIKEQLLEMAPADMSLENILQLQIYAIKCRLANAALVTALRMVLGSALMETYEHDWTKCDEPSCMFAREALAKAGGG